MSEAKVPEEEMPSLALKGPMRTTGGAGRSRGEPLKGYSSDDFRQIEFR